MVELRIFGWILDNRGQKLQKTFPLQIMMEITSTKLTMYHSTGLKVPMKALGNGNQLNRQYIMKLKTITQIYTRNSPAGKSDAQLEKMF